MPLNPKPYTLNEHCQELQNSSVSFARAEELPNCGMARHGRNLIANLLRPWPSANSSTTSSLFSFLVLRHSSAHSQSQSAFDATAVSNSDSASSGGVSSSSSSDADSSQSAQIYAHEDSVREEDGSRKVAVFWDLDNKPPKQVPPYDAALRLIDMAAAFGEVVDVAAYANRFAFSYLPRWVKEQRRERRELDRLETRGIVQPSEPYVCGYCGRKCKTNEKLKKHFRDLHERERNKRMNRMNSMKGNKRLKYKLRLTEKEERYKDAAREVLVPKVGYGLAGDLRRAGVYVRMVSDKPQAADEALKHHINRSIREGVQCICLVSDDSDFSKMLQLAQSKHVYTVVVGDTPTLSRFADEKFSWQDVTFGMALARANEIHEQWSSEDGLYQEYFEDGYELRRDRAANTGPYNPDSDSEEVYEYEDDDGDELWPMEGLVSRAPEKKCLTRNDFWWLPEDGLPGSEGTNRE